MLNLRAGLLALLMLALLIPTGCKDDSSDPIDVPEILTSPAQLSEWLEQLGAIIRATNTSGEEASRIIAYSSIAYYEGYAFGFENMRSLVGQLQGLDALPQPDGEMEYNFGLVAEAAMFTVVKQMYASAPTNIGLVISSMYSDHERDYLIAGHSEALVNRSREFGEILGEAILDWSEEDGFAQLANCSVNQPTGAFDWSPTPPNFGDAIYPCWGELRAFTFSPDQLIVLCHPGIPEEVDTTASSVYFDDVLEVQELVNNLNPAQIEIARFWNDGAGTFTVPGHYISILRQLSAQNLLDGIETVTAFAQLGIAMADTYISTYRLKYTYWRPRPWTVIQSTVAMNWDSEMDNPLTPEYPSLRSTMAFAATQVFINLYGDIEVKDNTYGSILGIDERVYSSFTQMGEEAAYSRLYAGTNLRTTLDNSEYHGRCIAQRANELFLTE
jgi:hypothetical protein